VPGLEATTSNAPSEIQSLQVKIAGLEVQLGRALLRSEKLETQLRQAQAQVAWLHRNLFGPKAERVDAADLDRAWKAFREAQEAEARGVQPSSIATASSPATSTAQFLLMLGGHGAPAQAPADVQQALEAAGIVIEDPADESTDTTPPPGPKNPPKRHKHGRNKIPDTLRREKVRLEPDLGALAGGARLVETETSYRIAIRPAEVYAVEVERPRYAIDLVDGETRFEVAAPPAEMIERGLLAPSALAHVLAMKWERHVPWNRMTHFFARNGYEISKSTLAGASLRAEPLARSLVEAMLAMAKLAAPYVAIDATGARVHEKGSCTNGHTWIRLVEKVGVFVSFSAKHDAAAANAQLEGWTCPFLADGAAVFNAFERRNPKRFGCMSHCRRKFFYAIPTDPKALIGIQFVNDLFEIERGLLAASAERRLAARCVRSAPIFDGLIAWCRSILADAKVGPRSLLAKAARYTLNQERRLRRFLEDGRVPIHNNLTELQVRHFAVGRKSWIFYGSEDGAAAGSTWLTLVLSARMHGLHVETYFRDLFRLLPIWPKNRLIELAPHAWARTRATLIAKELKPEYGPITIPPRPSG